MVILRVKELAEEKGLSLSRVQRETGMPLSTARRYWWNSRSGLQRDAGTLNEVSLYYIERLADLLGVEPGGLFIKP